MVILLDWTLDWQIFKTNKEWRPILEEAVKFCNESTYVYSGPHARQLHLVSKVSILYEFQVACVYAGLI